MKFRKRRVKKNLKSVKSLLEKGKMPRKLKGEKTKKLQLKIILCKIQKDVRKWFAILNTVKARSCR